MDKLMALIAFAVITGFLAILVIYVPRVDLAVLIGITVALVGYDFFSANRRKDG